VSVLSALHFSKILHRKSLIAMNKHDVITYDNLPEAVKHLLHEVADIKNYLLNQAATPAETKQLAPDGDFLTVGDVSQMLKLSKGAVYNMTSTRQIPFFKKCGRVYFDRSEIDEWIRQNRCKTLKQLQAEAEMESRKK
jgi:excisionase family DNA binding protein